MSQKKETSSADLAPSQNSEETLEKGKRRTRAASAGTSNMPKQPATRTVRRRSVAAEETSALEKTNSDRTAEHCSGSAEEPVSTDAVSPKKKRATPKRSSSHSATGSRSSSKRVRDPEESKQAESRQTEAETAEQDAKDLHGLQDFAEGRSADPATEQLAQFRVAADPETVSSMSRPKRVETRAKALLILLFRKIWNRIRNIRLTDTRMIALSVAGVMLVGALLLCTPWASADGKWTPFVDALFTATTSTCVTGLVTVTTAAHWSLFGQIVILILIQVGGIGFMTVLTLISFFMHRQISMHERRLLQQSVGSIDRDGVTGTFLQILIGTVVIEGIGAALLSIRFYPKFGGKGIWYAIFHSISAFCNAGIDLLSPDGTSLISYADDRLVTGTIMFLIIMGGLGFLVWNDIMRCGIHFKKMKLHSKLVLTLTFGLISVGTVLLFLTDRTVAFDGMSTGQKWWSALFQSVTLRTAGFVTVDQATLSNTGVIVSLVLMFIGGSPGSTAGGVKTTTMAVFFISILRLSHNREDVVVFKKRIYNRIVRQAGAVVGVYLAMALFATGLLCALEPISIREALFEVVSAIATVGLSMNVTATLGTASKLVLIVLMYAGRLGGLSLFLALGEKSEAAVLERPVENILIG